MPSAPASDPRLRKGISSLSLHDHVCLIYGSPEEQFRSVFPYVHIGIERGERVIYIADDNDVQEVEKRLAAAGLDVSSALRTDSLRILGKDETYLRCGTFDAEAMTRLLGETAAEALAEGFTGVRATGEMTWALGDEPCVERLMEYEARLNEFVEKHPVALLCQYNRNRFPAETILNVLQTHPLVLVSDQLCRSPYYVPPEEFLAPPDAEATVRRWLRNLLDQEEAAEALRTSESLFQVAFEEAGVGMAQVAPDGTLLRANTKLAAMLGHSQEDMAGKHYEDFLVPDDREIARSLMAALLSGEQQPPVQRYRLVHKDGRIVWVSISRAVARDAHGKPQLVISQLIDSTEEVRIERERARAEQDLAASQKRLQAAVDAGGVGIWERDLRTGKIVVEGHCAALFGIELTDFDGTYEGFRSRVHPDDIDAVEDAVERACESGQPFDCLHRVVWPDGSIHWVIGRGAFSYGEDGQAVGLFGTVTDYTRLKQAEEHYQRSEEMLRAIIESTGDGILVLSQEAEIRHYNTRFVEMWRISPSIGMEPRALLDFVTNLVVAPERFLQKTSEVQASDRASYDSIELKDGRVFESASHPLRYGERNSGRVWSFRDVTTRVRAEAALRESQERFQLFVENAPDAVFVQTDSKFRYMNPAGLRLFGAARAEDLLGRPVIEMFHPDFHEVVRERIRHLNELKLPVPLIRERYLRLDGEVVDAEVSAVPIDYLGQHGALVFLRDVTALVRGEEERRNLEIKIQQAQRLESLGVLAGGIAHDFNNLLTGILGNAELALRSLGEGAPACEPVLKIKAGARSAAGLTRQMLVYAGKGVMAVQPVDLSELVKEMSHLLEVSLSKRCTLHYRFGEKLPSINADPAQLRQVVMNLIINASESLGERDGTVLISTGRMRCDQAFFRGNYLGDTMPDGEYLFLSVSDTGCGMDPDTLNRVFEPFFTTKFTGRGLGLAAVLGIVKSHGGTLKVTSKAGQGTTFKVLFPACGQPAPKVEPVLKSDEAWRGGGRALVIDDESGVRTVSKGILMSAGFDVLLAKDGYEGLEIFRKKADEIDIVLLDMTMPRMDGAQTLRELQRIRADAKVILCSGYSENDATGNFAGLGLAGFLQKPFDIPELLNAVRKALEG